MILCEESMTRWTLEVGGLNNDDATLIDYRITSCYRIILLHPPFPLDD